MVDSDTTEACEVCGFEWESITPDAVVPGMTAAVEAWMLLLRAENDGIGRRPEPHRWSALEYGAHVRDVLLNVRDRIFVALAEEDPVTKPMYREIRIPFYAEETGTETAHELSIAGTLFTRTFAALTARQLERLLVAGYPRQTSRSILWMASQALHETEHHLNDARDNMATLAEPGPGHIER